MEQKEIWRITRCLVGQKIGKKEIYGDNIKRKKKKKISPVGTQGDRRREINWQRNLETGPTYFLSYPTMERN